MAMVLRKMANSDERSLPQNALPPPDRTFGLFAGRDRLIRADPAAPRRRIDARSGQACVLHRQQVMARGHTGAAHVHDLAWGARREQRVEFRPQPWRRLETAVVGEIVGKW